MKWYRLVLILVMTTFASFSFYRYSFFSTHSDFVEFYAAAKGLNEGENPYVIDNMLALQRKALQNPDLNEAVMFWSPPWILPLMDPLMAKKSYEDARAAWQFRACMFVFAGFLVLFYPLVRSVSAPGSETLAAVFVTAFCAPLFDAVRLNQSIPILFMGLCIFATSVTAGRSFIAGLGASLWLLKPHLFLFLALGCVAASVRGGSAKRTLAGLIVGAACILSLSEALYPGGTVSWLGTAAFSEDSSHAVPRLAWTCANLAGIVRALFPSFGPAPTFFIPVAACVLFGYALSRGALRITLPEDLSWLIPASILVAPYGWFYDQMLCAVSIFVTLRFVSGTRRFSRVALAFFLLNAAALVYFLFFALYQREFWWYPACVLAVTVPALGRPLLRPS